MAGLVPAIHALLNFANAEWFRLHHEQPPRRTLYVGVTNDLIRRCHEHRHQLVPGFTKRHGLKRLVYFESFDDIRLAIAREKAMKHWPRAWKVRLINGANREWADLADGL